MLTNILPEVVSSMVSEAIVIQEEMNKREQANVQHTNAYPSYVPPQNMQPPAPRKQQVNYTSNPALNAILNETEGGIPTDLSLEEQFNQMNPSEALSPQQPYNPALLSEHAGMGEQMTVNDVPTDVPDFLKNALTKDYSQVMKAVDQKKAARGPSNIDFSKL